MNQSLRKPTLSSFYPDYPMYSEYYVDKTEFIHTFASASEELSRNVYLFTRPRRFGKTLNQTMLQAFFDLDPLEGANIHPKRRDVEEARSLFEETLIAKNYPEFCQKHLAQWPVIFVSFGMVDGETYRDALKALSRVMGEEVDRHRYLLQSDKLSDMNKGAIRALLHVDEKYLYDLDEEVLRNSFITLAKCIVAHYGKKPIVLIDEYDAPLNKAFAKGYYEKMLPIIRDMLSGLFKYSFSYTFGCITGCLRISKESIFTGLNNLLPESILNKRSQKYFGFTEEEVREMLAYYQLSDLYPEMEKRYDGYLFGGLKIFNPYEINCRITEELGGELPDQEPTEVDYWTSSSGNEIIREFLMTSLPEEKVDGKEDAKGREEEDVIDFKEEGITALDEMKVLVEGLTVEKSLNPNLTYSEMYTSVGDIYTIMVHAGYLTSESYDPQTRMYRLRIPNESIRDLFREKILAWNKERENPLYRQLPVAFIRGDTKKAEELICSFLRRSVHISAFATRSKHENFYTGLLLGVLGKVWDVSVGEESGDGYTDLIIRFARDRRMAMILEVKDMTSNLFADARKALEQIDEKKYEEALRLEGARTILKYGISFYRKDCMVMDAKRLEEDLAE